MRLCVQLTVLLLYVAVCIYSTSIVESKSTPLMLPVVHKDSKLSPIFRRHVNRLKDFIKARQRSLERARLFGGGRYYNPLTAASEGEYLTTVYLGSPIQRFSAVFVDTGSSLVWLKCHNFSLTPSFHPRRSKTFRSVSCNSPICKAVQKDGGATCDDPDSQKCSFRYIYVDKSGSQGFIATDTLSLPRTNNHNYAHFRKFHFGCATYTRGIPGDGGLGLDRGSYSLMSQLNPKLSYKFSYCLPSATSDMAGGLFLGKHSGPSKGIKGLRKTKLLKAKTRPITNAYYVDLKSIRLGGEKVAMPEGVFNGGTVVDTGTTFILMPDDAFRAIVLSFITSVDYPQVFFGSSLRGVPCFDISRAIERNEEPDFPRLDLVMGDGAKLRLPWQNWFYLVNTHVACMGLGRSPDAISNLSIIGNRAMQNFHFYYDLKANILSFHPTNCSRSHHHYHSHYEF